MRPAEQPAPDARAARWLAPAWITLPLAARRCTVRNPDNGATAELSADQHAVLTACDGCRTLDEHGLRVASKLRLRDADMATVTQWLADFAALRLFSSLDELKRRFESTTVSPTPFAGIVVRTCDRPALLQRVLASAAALEQRIETGYRYHVLDDSRDASNRAANARIVDESGLDARHHDLSSRGPLIEDAVRAFPAARAAIEWLVGPPHAGEATYGRPINLALLRTAGRRVLLLDDDALVEPRSPPVTDQGWSISSSADELFCYADRGDLERACALIDIDPFAEHLQWLGAPAGVAWSRLESEQGNAVVELHAADAMRFAAGARIALTQNHAVGDPGSSLFPFHLLTLTRASQQHLLADARRKSVAFRDRVHWRGQLRTRLAPSRPLTFTTLAGLDNGTLLPPTPRAERNEDLLLGEMLRIVDRGAWSFDLPFALPHWREPAKQWLGPAANFRQEPLHFLMDYLEHTAPCIASDAAAGRLHAVAATLQDLARAAQSHLVDLLERQAADTASRLQFALATAQDDPEISAEWKAMLRPWIHSPALSTQPSAVRERIAAPGAVRALAREYGNALAIWPALWEWARDNSPAKTE